MNHPLSEKIVKGHNSGWRFDLFNLNELNLSFFILSLFIVFIGIISIVITIIRNVFLVYLENHKLLLSL